MMNRFWLLLVAVSAIAGCGDSKPSGTSVSALSGNPSVGQDGRVVVFESGSQVVIVDRVNATSLLIGDNEGVANSVVTPDGRFVAFDARPAGFSTRQVFLRDLTTGETTLVSASAADVPGTGDSTNPSISDDGRFVAFQSNAVDAGARTAASSSVLVRDVADGTTRSATSSTGADDVNPAISGNGQFVAFESRPLSGFSDIFLFNRLNSQLTPVSQVEAGPAPNGSSGEPSVSGDGRVVAFETRATNLEPTTPGTAALGGASNVVVRDVVTGTLDAASVPLSPGAPANGDSRRPTISRNGRRVAFESTATNLTEDVVQPGESNVFLRDLSNDTTELVTRPAAVPAAAQPPPSGLTTSTPVLPVGTTAPVPTFAGSTGTSPATTTTEPVPTPATPPVGTAPPTTSPAPAGPTLSTSTPVEPIGTVAPGTLSTSTPVEPLAPVTPLITGTPVTPTVPAGALPAGTTSTSTGVTVVFSAAPPGSGKPNISPDGGWVAYESRGGIYLANLRTGEITPVRRAK